ncbi:MAG TPA: hypothetical protein VHX86_07885 [Tepidisphaeraceae bacterium]|jgi:hypothetical protein|nr:hypothetical protein [Tepidisphaeraceae bacterium]
MKLQFGKSMDTKRFPQIITEMYQLIDELETMFEGRHFTPDGHTIGSIGEAIAAYYYGVTLLSASTKGRDARILERSVEIKATQGKSIALRHKPECLLVLKLNRDGTWDEVYNGPGDRVWELVGDKPLPKNGQYQVRCNKLRELMKNVPINQQLIRVKD